MSGLLALLRRLTGSSRSKSKKKAAATARTPHERRERAQRTPQPRLESRGSSRGTATAAAPRAEAPRPPQAVTKSKSMKDIKIDLTAEDAAAVQESWQECIGLSPANPFGSNSGSPASLFCSQFYENLFAVRPDLEFMFPDIGRQSAALSGLFSAALAMLESLESLDEILERMGRRHAYVIGVDAAHFELLGVILIQTLRDRLGPKFSPQIETTWIKIYSYLAEKMIAAGGDEPAEPAAAPSPAPAEPVAALKTQAPVRQTSTATNLGARPAQAAQTRPDDKCVVM
ncbi:globin-like protein [Dipodascopsis tothii]|uniref:globin-like protein n=1 Tax=Dipodascopsis tothii TaxID=44089 RepID=UPI0034CEE717